MSCSVDSEVVILRESGFAILSRKPRIHMACSIYNMKSRVLRQEHYK